MVHCVLAMNSFAVLVSRQPRQLDSSFTDYCHSQFGYPDSFNLKLRLFDYTVQQYFVKQMIGVHTWPRKCSTVRYTVYTVYAFVNTVSSVAYFQLKKTCNG